jgi:hypothetical protein
MFVRRVKKSNKSVSVRIVEGHRKEDGTVGQKLIKIVGTAKTEDEANILERAAREMIVLLKPRPKSKPFQYDIPNNVKFNEVRETARVNDGFIDIFGPLYAEFKFNNIIENTRKDEQWNNILQFLVLGRIISPSSKRKTVALLSRKYLSNIPLEKVYRTMDRVLPHELKVKKLVLEQTKKMNGDKINVMLFDVTTLYFESFTTSKFTHLCSLQMQIWYNCLKNISL